MFNYTKSELSAMAKEHNFVRDTLEKVLRLADILEYIGKNPVTKSRLVLKGGTAINLTVFNLPRLSVDIDLDFCGVIERDDMLKLRAIITDDIRKYMYSQGYSLNPHSKQRHSLDSFIFTYINLGGVRDNIKVEINYSLRTHIFEPKQRNVLTNVFSNQLSIMTLKPIEIFAAKINALLSRAAARDLYDIYNMIRFGLFNDQLDLLRKCVVVYTVISQEAIPDSYDLDRIDSITMRKIKTDLLPVIKKSEFVALDNIKSEVKLFLAELLILTNDEKMFLDMFKIKQFRPELVFNDEGIIERLNAHPMIQWKLMEH